MKKARIAVLASGKGSNLRAILEAASAGSCPVEVALVLSDKSEAGALQIARDASVADVVSLNPGEFPSRAAFDAACGDAIEAAGCEWIVLAGYMRILSGDFIARFRNRIVNIHPSLLPAFVGAHAVRDALAYGVQFTGVTVHLVDEVLDGGPILGQAVVPVHDDDTHASLHARIQAEEYKLFPAILARLINEGFGLDGRRAVWRKGDPS